MSRRLITYVLLCTSLLIVVLAQASFSRPSVWRWLQAEPESRSETALDPHPPVRTQTTGPRRAPYPLPATIKGAADGEGFLAPAADALPELQASARASLDADARYHLLQLAKDSLPGALEHDAVAGTRYQALLQKPESYRGEIIRIEGDLISLGEPMELHRKVPGMEVCYLGLMTNVKPEHQYLILFVDLPEKLKTLHKDWKQLYLRDVRFSGYFYKVARFQQDAGRKKTWMLPVLVGKAPYIPQTHEQTSHWSDLVTVFVFMAIPVLLITFLLPRLFRKDEQSHEQLMQLFRTRRDQKIHESLEELRDEQNRDLRFAAEQR